MARTLHLTHDAALHLGADARLAARHDAAAAVEEARQQRHILVVDVFDLDIAADAAAFALLALDILFRRRKTFAALFALFSLPPLGIYLNFENGASIAAWLMSLPLLSFPAYFIGFWVARGATPGKELLGLAVIMKDGKKRFGLGAALIRFAGFCLSIATLGLGFMLILVDGDTLHDRFARTRVVERQP